QLTLSPGAHTIDVQIINDSGTMTLIEPELFLTGFNTVAGVPAAEGVQALGPVYPNSITLPYNGYVWSTVASATVDSNSSGLYDLRFQASANGGSHGFVRYVVDGVGDPRYAANGLGWENLQAVGFAGGGWEVLTLNQQLTLSPGPHTVEIQV